MSENDVLRVKGAVGADGVSLEVRAGRQLPELVARLLPGWATRTHARSILGGQLLRKIQSGSPLAQEELEYAEGVLAPAEVKLVRARAIAERAAELLESGSIPKQLTSDLDPATARAGAADWASRFWDDAELVDDEMLRELYARILAHEATSAGRCSMRTLRAVRYLDRETAERFGRVANLAINGSFLPGEDLLETRGVKFSLLLDLADAGLLHPSTDLVRSFRRDPTYLSHGSRVLRLRREEGDDEEIQLPAISLTTAGVDLARIADKTFDPDYFLGVVGWVHQHLPEISLGIAEKPSNDWKGASEELTWTDWSPPPVHVSPAR